MTALRFTVPLRTKSALNLREHWAVRAKRVKRERTATALACLPHRAKLRAFGRWPALVVSLCRWSPGRLDDDNLRGALKAVRDELADALGLDDGSERVAWRYSQFRGPHQVEVNVSALDEPFCSDDYAKPGVR